VGVIDPKIDLFESLRWNEAEFKKGFANTPVLRAKYIGWRRNVAIALGNSNYPQAIPVLQKALSQESNQVVREALKWALTQFGVSS